MKYYWERDIEIDFRTVIRDCPLHGLGFHTDTFNNDEDDFGFILMATTRDVDLKYHLRSFSNFFIHSKSVVGYDTRLILYQSRTLLFDKNDLKDLEAFQFNNEIIGPYLNKNGIVR